jgi:hypothetical protein
MSNVPEHESTVLFAEGEEKREARSEKREARSEKLHMAT